MSDTDELRQERDDNLKYAFVDRAWNLRHAYQEWIQQELKDLIPKAEFVEPTLSGTMKSQVQAAIQRMKHINNHELQEAIENINGRCAELRLTVSDNVIEDRQSLADCLSRFQGLVRELLDMRRLLDGLWASDT